METTTETTVPEPETKDPLDLGKLTPEEQGSLMKIKGDSAQYLVKIGEFEVMKARLLGKLDQMDKEGQAIMDSISKRLGLDPGQQWVAMQDGAIRLVEPPGTSQAQAEATPAS
jgi:mannose-6-phosphate isomerase class I